MRSLLLSLSIFSVSALFSQYDLEPLYLGPSHYYKQPGPQELIITFTQHEASTVFNVNCHFQIDNGPVHSFQSAGFDIYPNMGQGGVNRFTLDTIQTANAYSFDTYGTHTVKMWLSPTGGNDVNPSNDTLVQKVKVIKNLPEKKILYEFYSHTLCGPCYDGGIRMDKIWTDHSEQVIPVFIHNANGSDPYEIPEGQVLDNTFTYAHPTLTNDQYLFPWFDELEPLGGYDYWDTTRMTRDRLKFLYPIDVEIVSKVWDDFNRTIDIEVEIAVYDTLYTSHNLNYWVIEDSILGYQASAPDPNNYWHRNILRAMPYGPWGNSTILPDTLYPGTVYYDQLIYTLPISYDEAHTTIIATVQGWDDTDIYLRDIRATEWVPFTNPDFVAKANEFQKDKLLIYPNPTSGSIHVKGLKEGDYFTIEDAVGKVCYSGTYSGAINLRLAPGTYLLRSGNASRLFIFQ